VERALKRWQPLTAAHAQKQHIKSIAGHGFQLLERLAEAAAQLLFNNA
jgi:dihydroneopterin aldolase